MSMIPPIDDDRFSQGMSTERYHPWYGKCLNPQPELGTDGIAGSVSIMALLSPEGGASYEECEPVNGNWHRAIPSGAVPTEVRYS